MAEFKSDFKNSEKRQTPYTDEEKERILKEANSPKNMPEYKSSLPLELVLMGLVLGLFLGAIIFTLIK